MNLKRVFTVLILIAVLGGTYFAVIRSPAVIEENGDAIGLVNISGVISGSESTGFLSGGVSSETVMSYLKQATEDPSVKAVVIRVNSPGGTAAASQEIAEQIKKLRSAGKKVVISMGDVAASGGYWISVQSDWILASPATMTGSIGVIMELANLRDLYRKLGIEMETVKSGPHKDIGSPSRPLTSEERDILQGMVNDIYDQFVDVVSEGRRLPREKVKEIADGRIFTGRQAKALGLIDDYGNLEDAIDEAARLGGVARPFRIIEYGKVTPWERLLGIVGGQGSLRWWAGINWPDAVLWRAWFLNQ